MALGELYEKPGYQIRRLRQIAGALFASETAPFGITSQQYTALKALSDEPRLEQVALCERVSLDRATMATLLVRLEEKGLVRRTASAHDKRRKHVALTPAGARIVTAMAPALDRIQVRILEPLAPDDRIAFARMLRQLVDAHTHTAGVASATHEEAS